MSKKSRESDLRTLSPEEQEQTFEKMTMAAVATIKDLLQNGSETTRLRASVWLLERQERVTPPQQHKNYFGEIRIGFDDDED